MMDNKTALTRNNINNMRVNLGLWQAREKSKRKLYEAQLYNSRMDKTDWYLVDERNNILKKLSWWGTPDTPGELINDG